MRTLVADPRADRGCRTALGLFERVGRDHALHPDQLGALSGAARDAWPPLWAAYDEHWRRFCGARLDPQFWRLDHPARWTGSAIVPDGAPVVIVGTGPSLRSLVPELKRVRAGVHLFTSPRGAEALAESGIVADLVLVDHRAPLEAMYSVADLAHRDMPSLARAPLVAAAPHVPGALLAGVSHHRLFVPDPLPTWGVWPATAVAMALGSGAGMVGLLGIDLGTAACPDAAQAPLLTLLALLASQTDVECVDLGFGGAAKGGWRLARHDVLASGDRAESLVLAARPWIAADARYDAAAACCDRVASLAADAVATLAAACRVRDGDESSGARADLERGLARLLAAGDLPEMRADVQDGLAASFLPRSWRTPPDPTLGHLLWRPAALASHELARQHAALVRRLARIGGSQ